MTSMRNPRLATKSDNEPRWSSQANQTLRRCGVCSLGLRQTTACTAACRHPLALHTGGSEADDEGSVVTFRGDGWGRPAG